MISWSIVSSRDDGISSDPLRPRTSPHQKVASLGQRDELLVSRGAHVEADRQHLLQGGNNERGLDGVELAAPFLVFPLLVLSSGLKEISQAAELRRLGELVFSALLLGILTDGSTPFPTGCASFFRHG